VPVDKVRDFFRFEPHSITAAIASREFVSAQARDLVSAVSAMDRDVDARHGHSVSRLVDQGVGGRGRD
jgi:hypothetical protein